MTTGYSTNIEGTANLSVDIICPLCSHHHSFDLLVTRSEIYYYDKEYEPLKDIPFTRLFTCPTTLSTFQATFLLKESRESHVKNIEIA